MTRSRKKIPRSMGKKINKRQYNVLQDIMEELNSGNKPSIPKIMKSRDINPAMYHLWLQSRPFRTALRTVLENCIEIDTLIKLKLRIENDDVSTTTLAKLHSEQNKNRPSAPDSFEDLVNGLEEEEEGEEDASSDKPVSNTVSSINVPRTLQ